MDALDTAVSALRTDLAGITTSNTSGHAAVAAASAKIRPLTEAVTQAQAQLQSAQQELVDGQAALQQAQDQAASDFAAANAKAEADVQAIEKAAEDLKSAAGADPALAPVPDTEQSQQ